MARCETCGTELQDASQRFCGGDRCRAVFMKRLGPWGSAAHHEPLRREYDMTRLYKVVTVLALILLGSLATTRMADGERSEERRVGKERSMRRWRERRG